MAVQGGRNPPAGATWLSALVNSVLRKDVEARDRCSPGKDSVTR